MRRIFVCVLSVCFFLLFFFFFFFSFCLVFLGVAGVVCLFVFFCLLACRKKTLRWSGGFTVDGSFINVHGARQLDGSIFDLARAAEAAAAAPGGLAGGPRAH